MKRHYRVFLTAASAFMLSACGEPRRAAAPPVPPFPAAPVPVTTDLPILASGANPDWSIRIESGIITVKSFDGALSIYPYAKPLTAAGSAHFAIGAGADVTTLTLGVGPCRDGGQNVSDPSMTAKAAIRGRNVSGCARQREATGAARDWVSSLFDAVPAMRACLARAQADGTMARNVSPAPDGAVSVLLRFSDGTYFSCVSAACPTEAVRFDPLSAPPATGVLTPAFARTAAAFARLACDEAPSEVIDAAGEVLGYLQRGHCATPASEAQGASAVKTSEPQSPH